ncbi:hypothetical protein [Pedobacter heparinus]|uniref:Uncharacterized protein n=1 Tax=Pedobacter heparinus (strain ATCC 13125 / DSM 2366 / CIP 104194 / JCM 7457 / NBRC 12017 / NCIMB 9290 / NRRL B-14731 / HIM 762-3) TaxID=485917 RepID=C6XV78_PEDHD|nr:hypothetical protein [Pedobacter heparinus]ACU03944.1 hypothetical protein Phep_1733 [Pedobacter heparinus DSM 2366]
MKSIGEESADDMAKKQITPSTPVSPRDGLDNTGTQGYDSLTDDAFTGSSKKPEENPGDDQSHTGSSSEDFDDRGD